MDDLLADTDPSPGSLAGLDFDHLFSQAPASGEPSTKRQKTSSSSSQPAKERLLVGETEQEAPASSAAPASSSTALVTTTEATTLAEQTLAVLGGNAVVAPDDLEIQMHNCVGSYSMKCDIDLQETVSKARNCEYNPKKASAALIVRGRDPRATALVYETGRVMVTGAKSPEECKLAGKKIAKMFQVLYPDKGVKFSGWEVENIIGIATLGFPIRLEGLAYAFRQHCSYEPEIFAGLVWKLEDPRVSLLVFVSGKVVLTGGKSKEDLEKALNMMYPILWEFQK